MVVLGHVVQDHGDRHRVVEVVAIDLLGLRTPGRLAGQAPVDRQRDADAGGCDVTAADEAARRVVLVELEAARRDVAAAGPRVDRVVEGGHRGAVLVEGHVAPDQVVAVGQPVGEAGRGRHEHQAGRLDRTAGQQEDVGLLLEHDTGGVLVDRGLDPSAPVEHQLADVALGAQLVAARGERVRDEHVQGAGAGAGRVAVLLRERADHGCGPTVEGPGERRLRRGERVPPELLAPEVELLGVARLRHRRAGVASAARTLDVVRARLAGDAEGPLDRVVVGLELLVGDRPVRQRRAGKVAGHGAEPEVVRSEPGQPALPVHRAAADHLRNRTERVHLGVGLRRGA